MPESPENTATQRPYDTPDITETDTETPPSTTETPKEKSPLPWIIGGVIGGLAIVGAVVGIALKKRKK